LRGAAASVGAGSRRRRVRNRNIALMALGEWRHPARADAALSAALAVEPRDDVRARIRVLRAT